MMATAPGLTAPTEVSSAEIRNMIHGIAARRPFTARTARRTSQSMVPLFCASANSQVMPTSVRNSPPGKPSMISAVFWPARSVPTRKAPTKASTPMLMGQSVATTNMATSA